MIDMGHLLWIIPVAAVVGFIFGAWLSAGDTQDGNKDPDACMHCMCIHCPYNPSLTYNENS